MVDLYANSSDTEWIKRHFYLDNVVDYHLFLMVFCIADNGNKNEFLSVRNITKGDETNPLEYDKSRFVLTPWDLDTSLGGSYDGENTGGGVYNDTRVEHYKVNKNYPFCKLLEDDEYMELMRKRWLEAREGLFSPDNVGRALDKYTDLFETSGAYAREQTTHKYNSNQLVDDLRTEVGCIKEWYKKHILKVDDFLGVGHSTGITGIANDGKGDSGDVTFDIWGRRTGGGNMDKGIYIRNGRKFVVK